MENGDIFMTELKNSNHSHQYQQQKPIIHNDDRKAQSTSSRQTAKVLIEYHVERLIESVADLLHHPDAHALVRRRVERVTPDLLEICDRAEAYASCLPILERENSKLVRHVQNVNRRLDELQTHASARDVENAALHEHLERRDRELTELRKKFLYESMTPYAAKIPVIHSNIAATSTNPPVDKEHEKRILLRNFEQKSVNMIQNFRLQLIAKIQLLNSRMESLEKTMFVLHSRLKRRVVSHRVAQSPVISKLLSSWQNVDKTCEMMSQNLPQIEVYAMHQIDELNRYMQLVRNNSSDLQHANDEPKKTLSLISSCATPGGTVNNDEEDNVKESSTAIVAVSVPCATESSSSLVSNVSYQKQYVNAIDSIPINVNLSSNDVFQQSHLAQERIHTQLDLPDISMLSSDQELSMHTDLPSVDALIAEHHLISSHEGTMIELNEPPDRAVYEAKTSHFQPHAPSSSNARSSASISRTLQLTNNLQMPPRPPSSAHVNRPISARQNKITKHFAGDHLNEKSDSESFAKTIKTLDDEIADRQRSQHALLHQQKLMQHRIAVLDKEIALLSSSRSPEDYQSVLDKITYKPNSANVFLKVDADALSHREKIGLESPVKASNTLNQGNWHNTDFTHQLDILRKERHRLLTTTSYYQSRVNHLRHLEYELRSTVHFLRKALSVKMTAMNIITLKKATVETQTSEHDLEDSTFFSTPITRSPVYFSEEKVSTDTGSEQDIDAWSQFLFQRRAKLLLNRTQNAQQAMYSRGIFGLPHSTAVCPRTGFYTERQHNKYAAQHFAYSATSSRPLSARTSRVSASSKRPQTAGFVKSSKVTRNVQNDLESMYFPLGEHAYKIRPMIEKPLKRLSLQV